MATFGAGYVWIPPLSGKCVAYIRASDLSYSRLNADAQRATVRSLLRPGRTRLINEFVEMEPLTAGERPVFESAVQYCRNHQATLLIGQLIRMKSALRWLGVASEAGIRFRGADAPWMHQLNYHGLVFHEGYRRRDVGVSVREALAQSKAAGKSLGGDRGLLEGLRLGPAASAETRRNRADRRDRETMSQIRLIRHRGVTSLSGIATRLNQMGISAPRGGEWTATQVRRVSKKWDDEN